jgi:uncharacterized membrane protein
MSVTDYLGGGVKMAPLQKRALYSLIGGLVAILAFVVVLVIQGDVTAFENDQNLRIFMYAAWIGVPLIYLVLVNPILRKPTMVDERDRIIIMKSSRIQWLVVIFLLAAWTITLTEIYHNQRQVPIAYITLIFVSVCVISTVAQSFGILVGYWGMNRNG